MNTNTIPEIEIEVETVIVNAEPRTLQVAVEYALSPNIIWLCDPAGKTGTSGSNGGLQSKLTFRTPKSITRISRHKKKMSISRHRRQQGK